MISKNSLFICLFSAVFSTVSISKASAATPQSQLPNPGPRSEAEAQQLITEASRYEVDQNYSAAIRQLKRYQERYPLHDQYPAIMFRLAHLYQKNSQPKKLIDHAKELLLTQLSPAEKKAVQIALADSYLKTQRYADARITVRPYSSLTAQLITLDALVGERKLKIADQKIDTIVIPDDSSKHLKAELLEPTHIGNHEALSAKDFLASLKAQIVTLECLNLSVPKTITEEVLSKFFAKRDQCFAEASVFVLKQTEKQTQELWCRLHNQLIQAIQKANLESYLQSKHLKKAKSTHEMVPCNEL